MLIVKLAMANIETDQARAAVGLTSRSGVELGRVAAEITAIGRRVMTLPLDLAHEA